MQDIHFGTDGWRAIIGEGFTDDNLARVIEAAAQVFKEDVLAAGEKTAGEKTAGEKASAGENLGVLYVGHDCRQDAHRYAQLAASVAAASGFEVKLTQDFCPTPALCFNVAHDKDAVGGIMLTSSHNPAEYLGVKLRMADGGASPKEFSDRVEACLKDAPSDARGIYQEVDLMSDYLAALKTQVDMDAIRAAGLRVVVDPLFGAGRGYLAGILREAGVEVCEINNAQDPTFDGLHPEPIIPWVNRGLDKVRELKYDALFVNDGDADRIAAGDEYGNFVNPHRIITLLVKHMVCDRHETGRVVSTITSSALLARMCKKLDLELVLTPVGFKWIYAEMKKGDVMIGGEESGGIGLPDHVKERDGLLMALLLTETMAQHKMTLGQLVDEMFEEVGRLEFARRGLEITPAQMQDFREHIMFEYSAEEICGKRVIDVDRRDGVKFMLEGDAWVMMRPSGTEPLVRVYAEAETTNEVEELLNFAEGVVVGN